MQTGITKKNAVSLRKKWALLTGNSTTGLAALHRLDMVAGGDKADIADMGDSQINSSIGPEWTAETRGGKMKKYAKEMCDNKCPMNIVLKAI